jgi:hypothetical protein
MSKAMSQAIGGHNLRVTMVMVLLAVLLLLLTLVVVAKTASTASDREGNPAIHAMSGTGGSSLARDPYIERHAEVVARHASVFDRYHQGNLRP